MSNKLHHGSAHMSITAPRKQVWRVKAQRSGTHCHLRQHFSATPSPSANSASCSGSAPSTVTPSSYKQPLLSRPYHSTLGLLKSHIRHARKAHRAGAICRRCRAESRANSASADSSSGYTSYAHYARQTASTSHPYHDDQAYPEAAAALRRLEWQQLCADVAQFASTSLGKARVEEMTIPWSRAQTELLLAETGAAGYLEGEMEQRLNFNGVRGVQTQAALGRALAGSVLTGKELVMVANVVKAAERVRRSVVDGGQRARRAGEARRLQPLLDLASPLSTPTALLQHLQSLVDHEGEVRDGASDDLKTARRALRTAQGRLIAALQGYGGDIIEKNGRLCVTAPPGDQTGRALMVGSMDGLALIEPIRVVPLNNAVEEAQAQVDTAVLAVCCEGTSHVVREMADVKHSLEVVIALDVIAARARYSSHLGGVMPRIVEAEDGGDDEGEEEDNAPPQLDVWLHKLQHPLLLYKALARRSKHAPVVKPPVPVDIRIEKGTRAVCITGPNTGGKTAALKALGLAALMARAGLLLPAAEAVLPWFDAVYADIGDEQSMHGGLSTFSAHLRSVLRMRQEASEESLVLVDELGTGTDPVEGAALALALVRSFAHPGPAPASRLLVATTHHSQVKALKYSHKYADLRCENACVEFDEEKLAPTYKLLWGIPGRSNALHIAARLGLPEDIIEEARQICTPGMGAMNEAICALEEAQKEYEDERTKAAQLRLELATLQAERANRAAHLEAYKEEIQYDLIRAVQTEGERVKEMLLKADADANRQGRRKGARGAKSSAAPKSVGKWPPEVGDMVMITKLNMPGKVRDVGAKSIEVMVNNFPMQVKLQDAGPL